MHYCFALSVVVQTVKVEMHLVKSPPMTRHRVTSRRQFALGDIHVVICDNLCPPDIFFFAGTSCTNSKWHVIIRTPTHYAGKKFNKQLFPNEIVFRFRKDIGSPRKSGVVIYSPWEVSGRGGFVVTCIGYYRKHILPFHVASGEGVRKWSQYLKWSPNWTANPKTGNGSCKWCRKKSRMAWTLWVVYGYIVCLIVQSKKI